MGTIPDMHSTTDFFVRLQKIYREKAEADAKAVYAYVTKVLIFAVPKLLSSLITIIDPRRAWFAS